MTFPVKSDSDNKYRIKFAPINPQPPVTIIFFMNFSFPVFEVYKQFRMLG
jgi:hypothetical protein